MFQSFSGSSRRPRQVNLSGRNLATATSPSPSTTSVSGTRNSLATAQHERRQRQLERDRLLAARRIQRHWRGYNSRQEVRAQWRHQWDDHEQRSKSLFPNGLDLNMTLETGGSPKTSDAFTASSLELRLLLHFFDSKCQDDLYRFVRFTKRLLWVQDTHSTDVLEDDWRLQLSRLGKMSVAAAKARSGPAVTFVFLRLWVS